MSITAATPSIDRASSPSPLPAFHFEAVLSRSSNGVTYVSGYIYGRNAALLELVPISAALLSLITVLALVGFLAVSSPAVSEGFHSEQCLRSQAEVRLVPSAAGLRFGEGQRDPTILLL